MCSIAVTLSMLNILKLPRALCLPIVVIMLRLPVGVIFIKSWLQLSVTGGQLYNFVFNGMLRNESDPSQATVTVAGVGYIDDYRFRGLQFNGGVYGKTNASLINVIEGNIRISKSCVYEIESVGTLPICR